MYEYVCNKKKLKKTFLFLNIMQQHSCFVFLINNYQK